MTRGLQYIISSRKAVKAILSVNNFGLRVKQKSAIILHYINNNKNRRNKANTIMISNTLFGGRVIIPGQGTFNYEDSQEVTITAVPDQGCRALSAGFSYFGVYMIF
jgi:hypothetical protein